LDLSKRLTEQFGKWFSKSNLYNMRQFYCIFPIFQTLSGKFNNLSRSHFVFLIQIEDEDKRNFYAIESNTNNRSLRELRRQFDTSLYHRLALSRNKEEIKNLASQWQIIEKPLDIMKDPYILEFLWLEEKTQYSESQLEQAIIDNIQKFIMELGKWFMFVARQQRISNNEEHYYIDLVFYHRFLKCFVLIDLKKWKLTHQDIGQMQMYVNYYDKEIKQNDEYPTIWLLLCEQNNHFVVKYTLSEQDQIFAKQYKIHLPSTEELESELKKILL
jgi:predicted nuclease of restriction endonuclease-like (RecB) superfamily